MVRQPNTVGGGANTNVSGLEFERNTDICEILNRIEGYEVIHIIYKNGTPIAHYYEKHNLYKLFLEPKGIHVMEIISKKLQFEKLFTPLGIVEYIYLLNEWFNQPCYKHVFDYIRSVSYDYYIEELPLSRIQLD